MNILIIFLRYHTMSKIKIGVAGNQWITEYLINKLTINDLKPHFILNMDETWSKKISGYTNLEKKLIDKNIFIYRPKQYNLNSIEDKEFLLKQNLDILLVFGWQRLIPEWFIESFKYGAWGVHGGPEKPPRCRGQAVFNWSLILGYKKFYMYLFEISPGVDEGKIAEITNFDILDSDDILTLYHKNCIVSSKMFIDNIPKIIEGSVKLLKQPTDQKATYLPKRKPENGGINWNWSSERLVNFVRALAPPYPGAFSIINNTQIFIFKLQIFDKKLNFNYPAGTIIEVFPNKDLLVSTKDNPVYIREWESDQNFNIKNGMRFDIISGIALDDPEV